MTISQREAIRQYSFVNFYEQDWMDHKVTLFGGVVYRFDLDEWFKLSMGHCSSVHQDRSEEHALISLRDKERYPLPPTIRSEDGKPIAGTDIDTYGRAAAYLDELEKDGMSKTSDIFYLHNSTRTVFHREDLGEDLTSQIEGKLYTQASINRFMEKLSTPVPCFPMGRINEILDSEDESNEAHRAMIERLRCIGEAQGDNGWFL